MRIGFDISQTGAAKAGCGYFAQSLLQAMLRADSGHEFLLYPVFGDFFRDEEWRTSTMHPEHGAAHWLGSVPRLVESGFWRQPPEDMLALLGDPDIVQANSFYCPRLPARTKLIYTLYDLSFVTHPEFSTVRNRHHCYRGVFNAALRAEHIVAISNYSRSHFLRLFPQVDESRISVVYPGNRFTGEDGARQPARFAALVPETFWLSVGTIEPRKNYRGLLEAYAQFTREERRARPLVMAGQRGWLADDFEALLDRLELRDCVLVTGYLPDEELAWLYRHCCALVYPSLFEGFGLPLVEAMVFGRPVITSNISSLPEIAGSGALLVPPGEPGEIHAAMRTLADDARLRQTLGQAGAAQSAQFSWDQAARSMLELYDRFK